MLGSHRRVQVLQTVYLHARALASASIAETAAEAPASVVMDATPLRSAVVRIS